MSKRTFFFLAVALCAAGVAANTSACPVCYGDSDSGFVRGAQWATVLMVGVTYSMLTGGVAAFVVLRRRAARSGHLTAESGQQETAGQAAAETGAAAS